jgi:hypothetical protein
MLCHVSPADAAPQPIFKGEGFQSFEEHPRADYYPTGFPMHNAHPDPWIKFGERGLIASDFRV